MAGLSEAEKQTMRAALERFMVADDTTRLTYDTYLRGMSTRIPYIAPNIQPWADLDERLQLALQAQTKIRNYAPRLFDNHECHERFASFSLNMMQLSLFVYWDLNELQAAMAISDGLELYQVLNNVEPFLCNMLADTSTTDRDARHEPNSVPTPADIPLPSTPIVGKPEPSTPIVGKPEPSTPASKKRAAGKDHPKVVVVGPHDIKRRNDDAREIAIVRDDHKCVVTHTPDPDMCHVVPYCINQTMHRADQMRHILVLMVAKLSPAWGLQLRKILCPVDQLGMAIRCSSDVPANLVALAQNFHKRWGKADLYFEWIDEDGQLSSFSPVVFEGMKKKRQLLLTKFRLRWHWLPKKVSEAMSAHFIDSPDTDKGICVKEIRLESEADIRAIRSTIVGADRSHDNMFFYPEHGRPVESGHLITSHAQVEDLEDTRTLVKLQELFMKMGCFSAAADVADKLDRDARHEPDIQPTLSAEWLERLAEGEAERQAKKSREQKKN
ncbi:hypothetical protein F5X68DRAFT_61113 [Plectosphaerella plurivora]|uniref:HNH nuclease domain-containing protein n=1 Tax=Plectosphaerella plurivora TaxID=936078 RepID=A0A9P8V0P3_9PEZI|nr:hypothetical protein F5X68DRAFT_61113 [Plectosphaerella plurivora]